MEDARFGEAGRSVVIEEFMAGEEVSLLALADGAHIVPLASAQDHKRVGDGDTGPNTGGMGAYSPAPALTPELEARAVAEILKPAIAGMAAEGRPFKGVLYAGLMLTQTGPRLVEFNVRFGDPETQVLVMRLKSDLLTALLAARDGTLDRVTLRWAEGAALTVVMAAEGYPGTPRAGTEIKGLEALADAKGAKVFHAATVRNGGRILADGGRVLAVTAPGATIAAAPGSSLFSGRSHLLAGRVLPARHWLAGGGLNGKTRARPSVHLVPARRGILEHESARQSGGQRRD